MELDTDAYTRYILAVEWTHAVRISGKPLSELTEKRCLIARLACIFRELGFYLILKHVRKRTQKLINIYRR